MAPQPEYDKEPKAPDKSGSSTANEDSKNIHNVSNDQQSNSDNNSSNTSATVETEDNKDVEALDDGQLRALLDEAITYKCPKDREGKSSLFKELLEEVEQDEQACEAASRGWRGGGVRGAPGLPHSNSLQELVAALAAEPAPRRRHAPSHHHTAVSARTHHGGSLPSGVDTSFLLNEEPRLDTALPGGYVATVRCVNPAPLVPHDDRRSKTAAFPMTYTARATLEIGSGAVSSGRAVTTTTASSQVRLTHAQHHSYTHEHTHAHTHARARGGGDDTTPHTYTNTHTRGPDRPGNTSDDHTKGLPTGNTTGRKLSRKEPSKVKKKEVQGIDSKGVNANDTERKISRNIASEAKKKEVQGINRKVDNANNDDRQLCKNIAPEYKKKEEVDAQKLLQSNDNNTGRKLVSKNRKKKNRRNEEMIPKVGTDVEHSNVCDTGKQGLVSNKHQGTIEKGEASNVKPARNLKKVVEETIKSKEPTGRPVVDKLNKESANTSVGNKPHQQNYPTKTFKPSTSQINSQKLTSTKQKVFQTKKTEKHVLFDVPKYTPKSFKHRSDRNAQNQEEYSYSSLQDHSPVYIPHPSSSSFYEHDFYNYRDNFYDVTESSKPVTYGPPEPLFQNKQRKCRRQDEFMRNYQSNSAFKKSLPFVSQRNNNQYKDFRWQDYVNRNVSKNNNKTSVSESDSSESSSDNAETDEYYRKKIHSQKVVRFTPSSLNPKNVRPMSLEAPMSPIATSNDNSDNETVKETFISEAVNDKPYQSYKSATIVVDKEPLALVHRELQDSENNNTTQDNKLHSDLCEIAVKKDTIETCVIDMELDCNVNEIKIDMEEFEHEQNNESISGTNNNYIEETTNETSSTKNANNIELNYMNPEKAESLTEDNSEYFKSQNKFLESLSDKNETAFEVIDSKTKNMEMTVIETSKYDSEKWNNSEYFTQQGQLLKALEKAEENYDDKISFKNNELETIIEENEKTKLLSEEKVIKTYVSDDTTKPNEETVNVNMTSDLEVAGNSCQDLQLIATQEERLYASVRDEQYVLAELSNNAYVFLTLPRLIYPKSLKDNNINNDPVLQNEKQSFQANNETELVELPCDDANRIDKKSLRLMWLEKLLKDGVTDKGRMENASSLDKVDSGIPFSCITTPEVVTSCNTTSSTQQSSVAVDAKKSLDENSNSVQGFSPLSGSSQHKKPRRKKSSKNETVITSDQINGYQGNKDLNEVLRFIESNAEQTRGKLVRGKHKDDSDDKGKKRSTERRVKDKEHRVKRATSMEELSRTKLEDLTDKPPQPPPPAERRSWGDDSLYYTEPADPPEPPPAPIHKEKKKAKPSKSVDVPPPDPPQTETAIELLDFQTVTKKKKQRKRCEESGGQVRTASPERRRKSAPPSDKSNDSNDDLDSVHSLPGDVSRAPYPSTTVCQTTPPTISYADIARTRSNIPDLIESCHYYPENNRVGTTQTTGVPTPRDADYPALRPAKRAPDVVSDRRPAVVLLAPTQPPELDGVTFGFDVNEQLLGGVRVGGAGAAARGLAAVAGLRYLPPPPPPPHAHTHLHSIVDYVGSAWEDVIKCGSGKVRYFSE